ncbi:MAG: hypothetical protein KA756_13570, partial [Steroidobacteraceae bacterium]|nr:hypothetical protein [Steroidobacteraceae bacterium]
MFLARRLAHLLWQPSDRAA